MDLVKKGLSDYRTAKPQDWSLLNAYTDQEFFHRYDAGDVAMETDVTNGSKRVSGFAKYIPPDERFRDVTVQREAGGDDRLPTDQGGDLLAISMGGRSTPANLEAMDGKLNQGPYKRTELQLIEKLKKGDDVYVEIESHHNDTQSQRPDMFTYNWVSRDSEGTMDCGFQIFENEYPRLDFDLDSFEFDPKDTDLIEDGIEMVLEEDLPEQLEYPETEDCTEADEADEDTDDAAREAIAAEFDDME